MHGVRVCDDCRNQPNGESEVHDELSSDMHRWGLWKDQGNKIGHLLLSNNVGENSGKQGRQISDKFLLPAKKGNGSVTGGSNEIMTSLVKAPVM